MPILQGLINRLTARKEGLAKEIDSPPPSPTERADELITQGNQLESAGKPDEACALYRRAVAEAPTYAKAHLNLAIGLEAADKPGVATEVYRAALAIDATEPYANYNFGKLRFTQGDAAAAEPLLRRALTTRPDFPEARVVLARILSERGELSAAALELEAAIKVRPDYVGALRNYADTLFRLERFEDAESALRRAVRFAPYDVDANYELAGLLLRRKDLAGGRECLTRVVKARPDHAEAQAALAEVCEMLGDFDDAAAALEVALRYRPTWVDALHNLGRVRKSQMLLGESEVSLKRALSVDPAHVQSIRLLGGVLIGQGCVKEALDLYNSARALCGEVADLESAELFSLFCSEDISADILFARHKEFAARLEAAHPPRFLPFPNHPDPERRLRVGYISGDFHYHVVSLFLIPLLEHHDRASFEIYCYSLGGKEDRITKQLRSLSSAWRDVSSLSDDEIAHAIHQDQVDILIDLSGYSGAPHPAVFAQRPAPVQATWIGYLNTTGLTRIQYRISDHHCDPPAFADRYHTERLARLPHSQWCYRPFIKIDHSLDPPSKWNGYVTFGSFNQTVKLSQTVRRLWCKILHELPEARLKIAGVHQQRARQDLERDLTHLGVPLERVEILPFMSLQDYYRQYDNVDIALDTTPYSGGTTTFDALWMGVPVITVPGKRSSSRSTASILTTMGLTDWIADSEADFVRRTVNFARDLTAIASLRRTLRGRLQCSPLMNEECFARDMENLYRDMWHDWCSNEENQLC